MTIHWWNFTIALFNENGGGIAAMNALMCRLSVTGRESSTQFWGKWDYLRVGVCVQTQTWSTFHVFCSFCGLDECFQRSTSISNAAVDSSVAAWHHVDWVEWIWRRRVDTQHATHDSPHRAVFAICRACPSNRRNWVCSSFACCWLCLEVWREVWFIFM